MSKSNAKEFCVVCNERIPDPVQNYMIRGNFCQFCNAQAEHNWSEKKRLAKLEAGLPVSAVKAKADSVSVKEFQDWMTP